jgi:hypothetical protein
VKLLNPSSPPLGKNYIATFISRHPELGYGYASRRDKDRAIKGAESVYKDFFDNVSLITSISRALNPPSETDRELESPPKNCPSATITVLAR